VIRTDCKARVLLQGREGRRETGNLRQSLRAREKPRSTTLVLLEQPEIDGQYGSEVVCGDCEVVETSELVENGCLAYRRSILLFGVKDQSNMWPGFP
jgi:hypothetical protein